MEENWTLRLARLEDLPHMLALVEDARAFMKAQGLDQWQNGYPNAATLEADIAAGQGWLLCAGGALCTGPSQEEGAASPCKGMPAAGEDPAGGEDPAAGGEGAWPQPAAGGRPLAMAALCFGREPDYDVICEGAWGVEGPYAAVHRVAVAAAVRGGGLAARLMAGLEALCRGEAVPRLAFAGPPPAGAPVGSIRVDTHPQNLPMQRLLEKCGYTRRGIILLGPGAGGEAGDKRVAYDKLL